MFHPLEQRRLMAVTANAAGGVLNVLGDDNPNAIVVSRDLAGNLLINGGAVPISGSPATTATIQLISVTGAGGNDNLALDETNGVLPAASLSGGSGNDTLTGGSGADLLFGDEGNDLLLGKALADTLHGGNGDDTLTGGAGTDSALGEAGDDRMIWNPGDGSDTNDGGDGTDTVEVNGGAAGETFQASVISGRVFFQRTNATPNPFAIDIGTSERLVLSAGDGNDTFNGGTGLASLMAFTVDGGAGDDSLNGTDGADTLIGGDGNDFIDGNAGADVGIMGAGDDVFRWDGGDGSDIVEGQAGNDLMLFNGAALSEKVDISANYGRVRFFRDLGNIVMDMDDTESIQFNALGGADQVTVHNLAHTDAKSINLNLLGANGAGDGQADSVIIEGTRGRDRVYVSGQAGGGVTASGLAAAVNIRGAEPTDKLTVNTFNGRDLINASELGAGAIGFAADGGNARDILIGGAGNDTLSGGNGRDILIGGAGVDQLDGGHGSDLLIQ